MDCELHVVSGDPAMRSRLTAALSRKSFAATSAVASIEELDIGDAQGRVIVVVVAVSCSPTRRVAIVRALAERDDVRVIVCRETGLAEVRRIIWAGAYGYVLEREIDQTLVPTVCAVAAGQIAVPKEDRLQVGAPTLSAREKQILGMVVMGYMNCDIAKQLYVAESTVKSHLSSAFLKLGVRSRSEAVELILDSEQGYGRGILAITSDARSQPGA
jgi:DNA-binding NarL/FixJ family response regulator